MDSINNIAIKAKALRKERKLTLDEVAERMGYAKSYIWEFEALRSPNPSILFCNALAECYGITLSELVNEQPGISNSLHPVAMQVAIMVDSALSKSEDEAGNASKK
jgi:transcriptional regulator with XRE-family HTH domain